MHLHRLLATAGRAGYFTIAIAFGDEAEELELPDGRLRAGDDRDAGRREPRTYGAVAAGVGRQQLGARPRGIVVLLVQNDMDGVHGVEARPVEIDDVHMPDRPTGLFPRFLSGMRVAGEHDGDAHAAPRQLPAVADAPSRP